ncbi:ATP-binding response regulator [Polaribacter cellanae]|uniref:histidine kinase n=1 Tax=Polaribacter cellanae TaxID=2818493 RepID=A0A975CNN0_9FLAO|nr:ATP-binding protein [Polaribacter cellanae]QTE22908.1 response regulator [Polaribacter cellanae]
MIPAKIEDVFLQLTTNFSGVIVNIVAGKFAKNTFQVHNSIYEFCPFLEGTLEALEPLEPFTLEGMVLVSYEKEYNVDIELFKSADEISILIHNRTNVYKIVAQLNQNRNDIFFIKRELAEKNEELKRLREIADKANEEKSRFLAMMSHEIRNPLNVILGYSEMISEEEINENVRKYSKLLSISGNNLKVIVNDILDLSRIEAGKLELINEPVNIKEIAKNCVENYSYQNKNEAVELFFNAEKNIPNSVLGDPIRINQILSNLLSNAIKFTQKGKIVVDVKKVSEEKDSIRIAFLISDSGRGMTNLQASKIFDEYQQNKKSDNRVFGGAGLGLSIVKHLLNAMNGKITVESKLNIGTVFITEIPFSKVVSSEIKELKVEEKSTNKTLEGKRILVADDDALNQTIVAHILKKEKVVLTQVKDGLEALNVLKTRSFDLVLLDIHMPNITGEQLVQQKNEFHKPNREIPFLSLTANTTKEDVERYKKIGFVDVISKPYTAVEFVEKILGNIF